MRNTKREVECITRLQEMSPVIEELSTFLVAEKLLSPEELKAIKGAPDKAKQLQAKLVSLSETGGIHLLEFEWQVLPVELIRLTLVTVSGHKEFYFER